MFREISNQITIQEFIFVVRIKTKYLERQTIFNILERVEDASLPLVPGSIGFNLTSSNIGYINRVNKRSRYGSATMSNCISFKKAGTGFSNWLVLIGICFLSNEPGLILT